ncbi:RHS repeat-associated protein [Flavobacterium cutihirudinis]|uniref:RHS repeat-associated protein n=1 Tax=Flavobacterium cutihirudinis TaxID=1265740 RepID=A0A3D9G0Q4_9FLAO|nr:DUF6443 domain-containing protein [Flavobacterium cutihirudinis]RED26132.1 RHS repeat-associated protein [Flavobacterium cutihirudinis]
MKKYISILLLFAGLFTRAQQFSNENFIYTEVPQRAIQSGNYNTLSKIDIQRSINYFDGLGRPKQTVVINGGSNKLDNNLLDWKNNWTLGSGSVPFFNVNGGAVENVRIDGVNPFGKTDRLWRCVNDAASDNDGGWNTTDIPIDKTKAYRYAVWVKRTGGQNGITYHGTKNVVKLDGSADNNPYFWYGNLPALDTWYLMVGMIHPSTYTGGDSGISGVYDMAGNKVSLQGQGQGKSTDFKWSSTTESASFRSYLFYSTDVNVSQYFYNPVLQKMDDTDPSTPGLEASISGLIKGFESADVVTHVDYDAFGRQDKEFLPYAASNTSGLIQASPLTALASLYNTPKYENTINYFSEKTFEASPLNRVLKQAAPGNSWKTAASSGHEVKLEYQANGATEVKLFMAVSADNMSTLGLYQPSITQTTNYGLGQLYKTVTKDENWVSGQDRTTEEFKDKEGRVVLKRTYNGTPHDTYYVYDQYGNLSYVLPPLANGAFDDTTLNNLCYRYKYDHRNRLVEKKLPGKEWEYIVYDKLDRPILTQDANQRATNKWLLTKYDAFSRPVYTGEYTNAITRKALQDLANASVAALNELRQGVTTIGDATAYYSNASFPNSGFNLYTVNYYDIYGFDLIAPLPSAVVSYGITPISTAKGLSTGSKVRVLVSGAVKWITNVIYYDVKGRPVYNYNYNDYLGITGTVKSSLDFTGKVLETTNTHLRAGVTTTVVDGFTYDHAGRLLAQKQKINSQTTEIIASNTYDDLGQLVVKSVGGKTSQNRLQNIDYSYNIRGWLKGINDVNSIGTDLFAFKISYDVPVPSTGGIGLFNGNISQTFWRTAGSDTSLRNYNYQYDPLNRLTFATDNAGRYNENPTYDRNGNIKGLTRNGNTVRGTGTFGAIDNLVYIYDTSSNKLIKMEEAVTTSTEGFKSGSTAAVQYTYDSNGNMKTDLNKGITTPIVYNYLNLPTDITLPGGVISYVYDATGVKQRKTVGTIITDYANGYQYENNDLKFFPHPEGYVAHSSGIFSYIYQYKDHLGNIRLSYGDANDDGSVTNLELIEENNYYPFGLKQYGYNEGVALGKGNSTGQKYKYNGKEFQDESVGGNQLNLYDYGARNYDPALGRWMNIDPLAEKSRRFNPYTYALNNPVYFIDPDGMIATPPDWFVNNETGAVVHVEGQSKLTQATADKIGAGDAKKYDRLGADDMFGKHNEKANNIRELGASVVENPEKFMEKQGYKIAEKVEIKERDITSKGSFGEENIPLNDNTVTKLTDVKVTYAKPNELNKKTNFSSETTTGPWIVTTISTYTLTTPHVRESTSPSSSNKLNSMITNVLKTLSGILTDHIPYQYYIGRFKK